jgi:hypothetical protein
VNLVYIWQNREFHGFPKSNCTPNGVMGEHQMVVSRTKTEILKPQANLLYVLAMRDLGHLLAKRGADGGAAQPPAAAAQASTLPDGNHGETLEVTTP